MSHDGRSEELLTDDLGRFRFSGQSPGRYRVLARMWRGPGVAREFDLAEEDIELEIELPGGSEFRVVVVDESGTPLAGCHVVVEADQALNGRTDANGSVRFSVPGVSFIRGRVVDGTGTPLGRSRIEVSRGGDGAASTTAGPAGPDVVLVVERLAMDRAPRVRVELPDRSPVPGSTVFCRGARGVTVEDGRCSFAGLAATASPVSVGAEHAQFAVPRPVEVVPDGQEVVLSFREAHPIEGRVSDADGHPVATARLLLLRDRRVLLECVTDDDGRFRMLLGADEAGPFELFVRQGGRSRRVPIPVNEAFDLRIDLQR